MSRRTKGMMWWGTDRTVILPTGVDLYQFRPFPRDEARAQLGWNTSDQVVLFNAGVEPKAKGIELVQAAVTIAEAIIGPIRLVVLDGAVVPEEVPVYMNASDCLAVASYSEGSPNIVKEALACNLPVVSVDVGDVAERIDGVWPSLIAKRTANEIGQALAKMLNLRQRSNGRAKVLALSEERLADEILSIYLDVLLDKEGSRTEKQGIECG